MQIRKIIMEEEDEDDRLLFKEALKEIDDIELIFVLDEDQLIQSLEHSPLPEVVFFNKCKRFPGEFECIEKLKQNEAYKNIPIVIYSEICAYQNSSILQT